MQLQQVSNLDLSQASHLLQQPQLEPTARVRVETGSQVQIAPPKFFQQNPYYTNIDIVTGSRMNCRVTTVEGLPSNTGLAFS